MSSKVDKTFKRMTVSLKTFRERKWKKRKRLSCSGVRMTAFKQLAFVSLSLKSCQLDNFGQALLAQLLVCCTERAVKFFDHCNSCCDGNCCIFALRRNWVLPVSCKGNSKIVSCFCYRFYHMLAGSLVFTRIPRVQALTGPYWQRKIQWDFQPLTYYLKWNWTCSDISVPFIFNRFPRLIMCFRSKKSLSRGDLLSSGRYLVLLK